MSHWLIRRYYAGSAAAAVTVGLTPAPRGGAPCPSVS